MTMKLKQLKIFFVCSKHSTFSEAADALFLSQPADRAKLMRDPPYDIFTVCLGVYGQSSSQHRALRAC
jgi:hypothetical protein